MKSIKKLILPVTATAVAFGMTNCDKDEETIDKLIGQWEITDVDGDLEDTFLFDDNDYEINLEFHMNGDAEFCSLYEDYYKYCGLGEWEWADSKKTEIEMEFLDGEIEIFFEIDIFEGDEITGEMTFDYDGESYRGDVVLERVYEDDK
ncbi:hypothetical protein ACFLTI_07080 [Bacteroidota bacterium]